MAVRHLFAMLSFLMLTSVVGVETTNVKEIIVSAVECEINGLDEQNAHYIPWHKLKENFHLFVAVGAVDSCGCQIMMIMQILEKLHAVRKRSEGHIENSRDVVRDQ